MKNTYVIAEIGINHNGSMELAKQLIDIASENGCEAVKFQKRDIDSVYTPEELDKPRESPWGTTNREQKEGLEFSIEQYKEIEEYCKEKGVDFIISCWDLKSLALVEEHLDVKYHKVASALLTDKSFLEALNETGKPIILSTGMSSRDQVKTAMDVLNNVEYVLACTSAYPTPDDQVNLRNVIALKEEFPGVKVGFSNHSNGTLASIGSVALGSECVEFHITHDRTAYGSDQAASIENVSELLSGIRKMEVLVGDGEKVVYDTEVPIAEKLRKNTDF